MHELYDEETVLQMLQGKHNTIELIEAKKIEMEPWRHMLVFPWYNYTLDQIQEPINSHNVWQQLFTVNLFFYEFKYK